MATPIPRNEARFTLAEIATATSGTLERELEHGAASNAASMVVTGVCTDSRAVEAGNLYVALRGEQHDGHQFVAQAFARGAVAALVEQGGSVESGGYLVRVPDTLRALGDLAAFHRKRWGGRVIGITGSAGKTTTKELTYAALCACGVQATRTEGNLNNLIGVPMTLLCLGPRARLAVLEMGTSGHGEIARLAEIAAPDVGVVTSVAPAHAEGLGSLQGVAREKAALLASVAEDGAVVCFADEPALLDELPRVRARRRFLFGRDPRADVRLVSHALEASLAMRCVLHVRGHDASGHDALSVSLRLIGSGPALDVAAVVAIALAEGLDLARVAQGVSEVAPVAGRMVPRIGPHGAVVLDDTYNANPASMAESIGSARALAVARGGRALLVLGDMRELGALSQAEHHKLGELCAQPDVALLIAIGPEMAEAASAAKGHAALAQLSLAVAHTDDLAYAHGLVLERITPADVVLVKASRGMRLERVVDALLGPRGERGAP